MHVEPSTCPVCKKVFDPLRSRALSVNAGRVRAFCSDACRTTAEREDASQGVGAVVDAVLSTGAARATRRWVLALVGSVLCAIALTGVRMHRARGGSAGVTAVEAAAITPAFSVADALRVLAQKPDPDVTRPSIPERDLWLHPLAGPARRLPIRASRKFRAPRDGLRPDECGSGHCGVDLGEEAGESVFATHDGVVERVVFDDVGLGGRYVRLNHRGGTLTTSYMHLGSVRPDLTPGVPVHAGDPLGTIGDTGINHSGPHLHFQIGVRARPGELETFIDPEPLLITWALRPPLVDKPPRRIARTTRVNDGGGSADAGPQGM